MFSLLVRRDGLIDPPAMSEIDGHCHILPKMDDGPADERGSLAIARVLLEMGVETVVATPHVISDIYPRQTDEIISATASFNALLQRSGLALNVLPGAEYYAENAFLHRIGQGDLLGWGQERYVMFEAPLERKPHILEEVIFSLTAAGFRPLLAHVERYRFLQGQPEQVERLRRMGVRFQVNHPSFLLPKTSRRGEMARWLYIKGLVDVLGTDMHRATNAFVTHPLHAALIRRFFR